MGRLSKRTIQCRAARRSRDLKQALKVAQQQQRTTTSTTIITTEAKVSALASAVNFHLLGEESLQRYQQTYGLGVTPGSSKEELVWAVKFHFQQCAEAVDEGSVLCGLVHALRRGSSSDSSNSTMM